MDVLQRIWMRIEDIVFGLLATPTDLNIRFAVPFLAATVFIAVVLWLVRGRPVGLLRWLFPREVYLHRSNLVDIKLFVFNRILGVSGFFGPLLVTPIVSYFLLDALTGGAPALSAGELTLIAAFWSTFVIVLANDFCRYWAHRLNHEIDVLWPFHAVHHSAEVMTPLTLARSHPMEAIFRIMIIGVIVGIVQGATLFVLGMPLDPLTIGGANAFYFVFNAVGANLRHSHIWLSYGPLLEHIFISPAQHQIHHSSAVEHHNKNYGSMFAIWDWAFGTLYVPKHEEKLTFGLADGSGARIEQPHPTMRAAIFGPFVESWRALRRRLPARAPRGEDQKSV